MAMMTIQKGPRAALVAALALAATACDGSPAGPTPPKGTCVPALEGVSQVVDSVVNARGVEGGLLLVMQNGQVLCERAYGGYEVNEVVPIASASKWLTAVTMLTLVDDGQLSLDAPISQRLDYFGTGEAVTLRQLLSHTSGLSEGNCAGVFTSTLHDCAQQVAQSTRAARPGTRFIYGGGPFTVAGALAETVAQQGWPALWRTRVAEPLGLTDTEWDNARNPLLSGGASSTMQDYAKVMRMIVSGGESVLSAAAIEQMRRNNVGGVQVLFSPRNDAEGYTLGAWIDDADAQGRATVLSSVGASGFYPWLDFERNVVGIVVLPPAGAGDGYWYPVSRRVQAEVRQTQRGERGGDRAPTGIELRPQGAPSPGLSPKNPWGRGDALREASHCVREGPFPRSFLAERGRTSGALRADPSPPTPLPQTARERGEPNSTPDCHSEGGATRCPLTAGCLAPTEESTHRTW
jgi:CubicO group peptidase (beta-lactamase class C family)